MYEPGHYDWNGRVLEPDNRKLYVPGKGKPPDAPFVEGKYTIEDHPDSGGVSVGIIHPLDVRVEVASGQVNWGHFGACGPEVTRAYAELLVVAAHVAEQKR